MRIPSWAKLLTRASIMPASGWWSRTWLSSGGRALVSRNAPLPEMSRKPAGAGLSATIMHMRRRRQGVAIRSFPAFCIGR